mmetsp:Transcript_10619/g.21711  ORF Transcript_10619/g.21711 Transcript_10619/m.21711 type:complete len:87 (-) Transcript_10619:1089-1349(-)
MFGVDVFMSHPITTTIMGISRNHRFRDRNRDNEESGFRSPEVMCWLISQQSSTGHNPLPICCVYLGKQNDVLILIKVKKMKLFLHF